MNSVIASKIYKLRSNKQTSVQKTIITIFIVTYCFTLLALYTSFSAQSHVVEEYDQYIKINKMISEVSIKLPKSHYYFEQFVKSKEIEYLESYAKTVISLEALFQELDNQNKFNESTNVFYRNTKNMFKNYKLLCTTAVNTVYDSSPDSYKLYSDIELQMDYINSHMQQLTKSYIEGHNISYQKSVEVYNSKRRSSYIFIIFSLTITVILTFIAIRKILHSIKQLYMQAGMLSEKIGI